MRKTNNDLNDSKCRKRVYKLFALLREIASKHNGDFYCLNCLHSFRKENKFKSHDKVCKYKDFWGIVMLSQNLNILQFNQ